MNHTNVAIISDCFVNLKFQSEEAKKPIYLSPWDLVMVNLNYIKYGLLFALPEKNQGFSITTFLEELKDSLSVTLTHFHPLAARLATVKQENPGSMVVYLSPDNSPGARFIHSSVDLTVADVLTPTDVPVIVDSFFDHHKAINHDGHQLSLMSVQVTKLVDGIFIGCSINHMVADGTSYWHFFNSWSETFNSKGQNSDLAPIPISRPPIHDRWIPAGSDPIIKLPFTPEDEFIDRPNPQLVRERIFHLSSNSLAKLKSKVNSECNTTNISTLQSVFSLVWGCMTRARRLRPDQETMFKIMVNNRSRVSPSVPENYFGNMIQAVSGIASAGDLLDHGVGWAALRLHEAVTNHGDKQVKGLINAWVERPWVIRTGFHCETTCDSGSSPRFDMYGNEFGLGKALAVLSGCSNKTDGKVLLYPGREGGGSMDLDVCLFPETMAAFETDDEFISVVNGEFPY